MTKKAFFFIDDVIWMLRDIAKQKPKSVFQQPFLSVLKKAHDLYGMKVQLNLFLRTDFYYGGEEFNLSQVPDSYKAEWEEASDWLKFGFHAKQEFPDYPYVNADYEDVRRDLEETKAQVCRFAGERSFAKAAISHWLPISKEGCQALFDGGIRLLSVSSGERQEYNGDPFSLPYGHAGRLLQNRKPETKVYRRGSRDVAIDSSICAYNHISDEVNCQIRGNFSYYKDEATGMGFKRYCTGPCLNLVSLQELESEFEAADLTTEYFGYATHEQYFYPDYYAYQPDYSQKILKAAEIINRSGYEYFFAEEMVQ